MLLLRGWAICLFGRKGSEKEPKQPKSTYYAHCIMLIIYTTCANTDEAKRLAKEIIDKKLAACVNFWPIGSMYTWEGKFKAVSEVMISIKTFESKRQELEDFISHDHKYSCPIIAGVDIRRINRSYKEWMTTVMR